jgi:hypothetical protein
MAQGTICSLIFGPGQIAPENPGAPVTVHNGTQAHCVFYSFTLCLRRYAELFNEGET